MALQYLKMGNTKVEDISILANMPLSSLYLHQTPIKDFRPILTMKKLRHLVLPKSVVELDITYLKEHKGLNNISLGYLRRGMKVEDFWTHYEKARK